MQTTRPALLVLCMLGGLSVGGAAQETRKERLLSSLPRYDPSVRAAREQAEATRIARPPEEADVHVLPDYLVVEKKLHRPNAQELMTRATREREAILKYARDMNALELALNRWHIPFLSASFADRAIADQEAKQRRQQFDGYAHLASVVGTTDPAAAKQLRDAMDMKRLPKP